MQIENLIRAGAFDTSTPTGRGSVCSGRDDLRRAQARVEESEKAGKSVCLAIRRGRTATGLPDIGRLVATRRLGFEAEALGFVLRPIRLMPIGMSCSDLARCVWASWRPARRPGWRA